MKKFLTSLAMVAGLSLGLTACSSGPQASEESGDAYEVEKTLQYTQLKDANIRAFWSRLQDYTNALALGEEEQARAIATGLSQSAMRYRKALDDAQFDEESAYRRGMANVMLGFTGDPSVVPGILAVATNLEERSDVRSRAVFGLAVMGERINESNIRDQVASSLKIMMLPGEDNINIRLNAVNAYGAMFNASMGDTVEPIKNMLGDDPSNDVRRQALVVLGDIADASTVIDIVENGLKDGDPNVRAASAQALGQIQSVLSLESLRRAAINDDSGIVRAEAVYALAGQTGVADDSIVVDQILVGINDRSDKVREASARAAAKVGSQDAIVPLLGLTQDTSTDVRISAIKAIGEITPPAKESHVMPLVDSLNDGDPYVVREAQRSLSKVTTKNYGASTEAWTTYFREKYPKLTGADYDGPLPPVGEAGQARGRTSSSRTSRNTRNTRNNRSSNRSTNRSSNRRTR